MSFYIGNDSSGYKIVHLTSSRDAIATMKGSPISTTIYHSRMQMIEFEKYTLSRVGTEDIKGTLHSKFTGTGLSVLLADPYNLAGMALNYSMQHYNYFINRVNNNLYIAGDIASIVFLVIKQKRIYGSSVGRHINMDADGIYSGSVNYTRMKYFSNGVINTHDPVMTLTDGTQYQLVNYNYKSSGLDVFMNGSAPHVKLGGHKVLGGGKVPSLLSTTKANYYVVGYHSQSPFPNIQLMHTISSCAFVMFEVAVTKVIYGTTTNYSPPKIFRTELVPYGATVINEFALFDVFIGWNQDHTVYGVWGMAWTVHPEVDIGYYYDVEVIRYG